MATTAKRNKLAPPPLPSVTTEFVRVEEKKTCWSYARANPTDQSLFVGDFIYVLKRLFAPSDPPKKLSVTIQVLPD